MQAVVSLHLTMVLNNSTGLNDRVTCLWNLEITFMENSTAWFSNNKAENGGIFHCSYSTAVVFKGTSTVLLIDNKARLSGGVMYIDTSSEVSFLEYTNVSFNNNSAFHGGVLFATANSNISFEAYASVNFQKIMLQVMEVLDISLHIILLILFTTVVLNLGKTMLGMEEQYTCTMNLLLRLKKSYYSVQ